MEALWNVCSGENTGEFLLLCRTNDGIKVMTAFEEESEYFEVHGYETRATFVAGTDCVMTNCKVIFLSVKEEYATMNEAAAASLAISELQGFYKRGIWKSI